MPRSSFVLGLVLTLVVGTGVVVYVTTGSRSPGKNVSNEPAEAPSNGVDKPTDANDSPGLALEAAQPDAEPVNAVEGDAETPEQIRAPGGDDVPGSESQASPPSEMPAEEAAGLRTESEAPPPSRIYLFWDEFLSIGQAEKFAAILTRQSGIDVQPQKVRDGYRMGLAFSDDLDLDDKVRKIEATTHFDIDEGDGVRLYVLPEEVFSSHEAAEQYAEALSEVPEVDVRPLQTKAGFFVGATYSHEADLLRTLEAIEAGKASSAID